MVSSAVCHSEAEGQVDLWDFEASLVGLVRVQDSQPRLHRETLSKNKNKTRKIETNKKTLKKKNPSYSMEGEEEKKAVVLGQGLLESSGPEMRVASTDENFFTVTSLSSWEWSGWQLWPSPLRLQEWSSRQPASLAP